MISFSRPDARTSSGLMTVDRAVLDVPSTSLLNRSGVAEMPTTVGTGEISPGEPLMNFCTIVVASLRTRGFSLMPRCASSTMTKKFLRVAIVLVMVSQMVYDRSSPRTTRSFSRPSFWILMKWMTPGVRVSWSNDALIITKLFGPRDELARSIFRRVCSLSSGWSVTQRIVVSGAGGWSLSPSRRDLIAAVIITVFPEPVGEARATD